MLKIQVQSEIFYKIRLFVENEDGQHVEIEDQTSLMEDNQLFSEEERSKKAIAKFYGNMKAFS